MHRFPILFFLALILILVCAFAIFKGFGMLSPRSQFGEMGSVIGGVVLVLGLTGVVLGGGVIAVCVIADDAREMKEQLAKFVSAASANQRAVQSGGAPTASNGSLASAIRDVPRGHILPAVHEPETRVCAGCGISADTASHFCDNCGRKLG